MKCNYYSQGCQGGFAFEIARFAKENSLISTSDWNNIKQDVNSSEQCQHAASVSQKTAITIKNYQFILGSYPPRFNKIPNPFVFSRKIKSKCDYPENEKIIMYEILNNGPIVLNLMIINDLFRYTDGVYVPTAGSEYMDIKLR